MRFIGDVVAKWLANSSREMQLVQDFAFVDSAGVYWQASKGDVVNGASIPRLFWVWGSPFVGLYRRASVIHDVYCKKRLKTSEQTHKVFYEMCLADGVGKIKAKLMYQAVKLGGGKW